MDGEQVVERDEGSVRCWCDSRKSSCTCGDVGYRVRSCLSGRGSDKPRADSDSCEGAGDARRTGRAGILVRGGSAWVGVHYSPHHKRFCCNLIPFVTIWFIKKGGTAP